MKVEELFCNGVRLSRECETKKKREGVGGDYFRGMVYAPTIVSVIDMSKCALLLNKRHPGL